MRPGARLSALRGVSTRWRQGQEVAAGMPDARFEVIPDAGHVLQLDRPDTVAATITDFLAHAETT
jgi:pimeloyl-ACP methyl ester carboxylesterase